MIFYVVGAITYIFVYVPAAGRTASAIGRNRVGPLSVRSPIGGGRVRARGGYLQHRGASSPCTFCTFSAIWAGVQGQNRPVPESDRSRPPSLAIEGGPGMWEPSVLDGKPIACIFVELLDFLCCRCNYVYFCVCTCRRPYRFRHRSESSGTSSGTVTHRRRSG